MTLFLFLLPWILLIFVHLLINPAALYIGGKVLKIDSPNFKFTTCIWISLVAGLLANFLAGINPFLAFAVYALLLGYMMKKQFLLQTNKLIIILVFMVIFSFVMNFLQILVITNVLISQTTPVSQTPAIMNSQQTGTESQAFNICQILSDEKATQITGISLKGSSSNYYTCHYGNAKDFYLSITYDPNLSIEDSKKEDIAYGYKVQPLDEIQKGAYYYPIDFGLLKVHFMFNNKHYVLERNNSEANVITDGVMLSLVRAILQPNGTTDASSLSTSQSVETQIVAPIKVKRNNIVQ